MAVRVFFIMAIVCLGYVHNKSVQNLSCKQIQELVDGHNSRRLLLAKGRIQGQPAASKMKYMVWHEELAAKAAKWAAQNKNYHNPDRKLGSGIFQTGENMYWYKTTDHSHELLMDSVMSSWFNEFKDYSYGPLKMNDFDGSSRSDIGHYTQMAWSETTYLGCAMSKTKTKDWITFNVVCNYGPQGNVLGQHPYESGSPSGKLVCGNYDCSQLYGDQC